MWGCRDRTGCWVRRTVGVIVLLPALASAGTFAPTADDERKTHVVHDAFVDAGVRGSLILSTLDTQVGLYDSVGPKSSTEMLSLEGYFTVGHIMTCGFGILQLASDHGGRSSEDNPASFSTAGAALSIDLVPFSIIAVDPHVGITISFSGTFVKVEKLGAQLSFQKLRLFADFTHTSFNVFSEQSSVSSSGWGFGVTLAYSLGEAPP